MVEAGLIPNPERGVKPQPRVLRNILQRVVPIDDTREMGSLWEAIEWISHIESLHKEIRALSARPGLLLVYEVSNPELDLLIMELHPYGGEWTEMQLVEMVMGAPDTGGVTWGISTYLEGYEVRMRDRTRFPRKMMDNQDLGAFYATWRYF